jgi:hypothetical protein
MRNRFSCALVFVLFAAFSISAFQGDDWVKLAPAASGFSVMMPGKAEEENQPSADFTLHLYSVSTAGGIYMASYGDYAPGIHLDPVGELAANRDNFLKGLNARLIASKNINLEGHAGLEFTGENDMAVFNSRVYIIGNRVYQIMTAIDSGKDDSANVQRFLASFAFTKTEPVHKP